jgi:hypothetical protein
MPLANRLPLRHIESMIPLDVLRGFLGLLCLFFAHFLGRAMVRVRVRHEPLRKLYGWLVRTLITVFAILYRRGFDSIAIAALALAAASLAAGVWDEYRPKREEDLTGQMFGE